VLTGKVTSYEIPTPFSFVATQDGVTIAGSINGADGDESCDILVQAHAKPRFSQEQKDAFKDLSERLNNWSIVFGFITAITTPPDSVIAALMYAADAYLANKYSKLAEDPPDPNYTAIASARPIPMPSLTTRDGLTRQEAKAWNALLANEAAMAGILDAMITTVNRADGAEQAGDAAWVDRQTQALAACQVELSAMLEDEAHLRQQLTMTLQASGTPQITIHPEDIQDYERTLASTGWPPEIEKAMEDMGLDSATINAMLPLVYAQDPNAAAGQYPDLISSQPFITVLQDSARVLAGAPLSIRPHLPENLINPRSRRSIRIALLSTPQFDATAVERKSLRFGPDGARPRWVATRDIDGNGRDDLVLQFGIRRSGFSCGASSAVLTGRMKKTQEPFVASDAIRALGLPGCWLRQQDP
jgi:hypothetical protein